MTAIRPTPVLDKRRRGKGRIARRAAATCARIEENQQRRPDPKRGRFSVKCTRRCYPSRHLGRCGQLLPCTRPAGGVRPFPPTCRDVSSLPSSWRVGKKRRSPARSAATLQEILRPCRRSRHVFGHIERKEEKRRRREYRRVSLPHRALTRSDLQMCLPPARRGRAPPHAVVDSK